MVAHEAVTGHANLAEVFIKAHKPEEVALFVIAPNEAPVHDAGDAVVIGHREMGGSFGAGQAHGQILKMRREFEYIGTVSLHLGQTGLSGFSPDRCSSLSSLIDPSSEKILRYRATC